MVEQLEIDIRSQLNNKLEQDQKNIDRLYGNLRAAITSGNTEKATELANELEQKNKERNASLRNFFDNSNTEEFYEIANDFVAEKGKFERRK